MKPVNQTRYRSIKGFNGRVRFLIMHYTATNFSASVNALTGPSVSAHYLVPNITDTSYRQAGFDEQEIFNLVDEQDRAWHAGVSHWSGRTQLNDTSIGIELVNQASSNNGVFHFPPYDPRQIEALKALALTILQRHPDITPVNVLGHSDVAIGRKSDPGPSFPWYELYQAGVGAWFDTNTHDAYLAEYTRTGLPGRDTMLSKFKKYGYDITNATTDQGFKMLVRAFQLHFRPQKYDGVLDLETAASLAALVRKYFP